MYYDYCFKVWRLMSIELIFFFCFNTFHSSHISKLRYNYPFSLRTSDPNAIWLHNPLSNIPRSHPGWRRDRISDWTLPSARRRLTSFPSKTLVWVVSVGVVCRQVHCFASRSTLPVWSGHPPPPSSLSCFAVAAQWRYHAWEPNVFRRVFLQFPALNFFSHRL